MAHEYTRVMKEQVQHYLKDGTSKDPHVKHIFQLKSGTRFLTLRKTVRGGVYHSFKKIRGRGPNSSLVSVEEQLDILHEALAEAFNRYQTRGSVSTHATQKVTYLVINRIRNEEIVRCAALHRRATLTPVEMLELQAAPLFSQATSERVADIERLHDSGIITELEYYFILATVREYTLQQIADLISDDRFQWKADAVRKRLDVLTEKIIAHTDDLLAQRYLPSETPNKKGKGRPPRVVNLQTLRSAIRIVLGTN